MAEIAADMKLTVAAVETFEQLFYNVIDRRSAIGWVLFVAIGSLEAGGSEQVRRDRFVKWLAYSAGPVLLHVALESLGLSVTARSEWGGTAGERQSLAKRIRMLEAFMTQPLPALAVFRIAENSHEIDVPRAPDFDAELIAQRATTLLELLEREVLTNPPEACDGEQSPSDQENGAAA